MSDAREYTEWSGQEIPGSEASVFIQWKGTDVCMDFHCPCGHDGHLDAMFAYSVRCPKCLSVFDLGTQVRVRRAQIPFGWPKELS